MHGRVFLVSHFAPSPVGHGGVHRTLQLEHDARALVGDARFASVNLQLWREARQQAELRSSDRASARDAIGNSVRKVVRRATQVRENPFKLLRVKRYPTAIPFSTTAWVEPEFVSHYASLVSKECGPTVCIVEHAVFGEIVELNQRLGIPTISAFQNLEALDVTRFDWRSRKTVYSVMTDLGNELRLLGRCADRLVISKVEAGFVGGLGLDCHYYPYLPVGAIRDNLYATRQHRACGPIEPGLIVLLGSAGHAVTAESMKWFVQGATECGLPAGIRVVAVGLGTDKLLSPEQTPPGLELRGWLAQAELDALLARAAAAVIPQRLGFGALTRLPELACAGVPVITFSHPAYALNPTPGLRTVAQSWPELCAAMRETLSHPVAVGSAEYERWESEQPRPLASVLNRLLGPL